MSDAPMIYREGEHVRVEWPSDNRPEWVKVTPDVIDEWAANVNAKVDEIDRLRALLTAPVDDAEIEAFDQAREDGYASLGLAAAFAVRARKADFEVFVAADGEPGIRYHPLNAKGKNAPMTRAADEIDRLRAENAELHQWCEALTKATEGLPLPSAQMRAAERGDNR